MKLTKTIKLPSGTLVPAGTELHFGNESTATYAGETIVAESIPGFAMEALTITRTQLDKYIQLIARDLKAKSRYDVEVDDKTHFLKAKLSNGVVLVFDIANTNIGHMIAYSIDGEKFYDLPSDIKSYKDFRGKLKALQAFAAKAKDSDEVQLDKITKSDIESKPQIVTEIDLDDLLDKLETEFRALAPALCSSYSYLAQDDRLAKDDPMKLGKQLLNIAEKSGITEQMIANAIERDKKEKRPALSEVSGALDLLLYYVLKGKYQLGLGYIEQHKGNLADSAGFLDIIPYLYGRHLTKLGQAAGWSSKINQKDLQNGLTIFFADYIGKSLVRPFKQAFDDGATLSFGEQVNSVRCDLVLHTNGADIDDALDALDNEDISYQEVDKETYILYVY